MSKPWRFIFWLEPAQSVAWVPQVYQVALFSCSFTKVTSCQHHAVQCPQCDAYDKDGSYVYLAAHQYKLKIIDQSSKLTAGKIIASH
jgi:hypothetical protein